MPQHTNPIEKSPETQAPFFLSPPTAPTPSGGYRHRCQGLDRGGWLDRGWQGRRWDTAGSLAAHTSQSSHLPWAPVFPTLK